MSRTKDNPDSEYKYFIFDPLGDGFIYYKSEKDRDKDAQDTIDSYLDETWYEEVERVCVGEVTGISTQYSREDRPKDLDNEGYAKNGDYWPDNIDYKCSYCIEPIAQTNGEAGG